MSDASGSIDPLSTKRLLLITLAALAIALVVLVLFVLPAEYGIDPSGVGGAMGLTRLAPSPDDGASAGANETPTATTPSALYRAYASTFPTRPRELPQQSGYLSEGEEVLVPFDVVDANLTRISATLTFADENTTVGGGATGPDTFAVSLEAPNGERSESVLVRNDPETGGGTGVATFFVRAPPPGRTLDATSADEARAAFMANDPADASLAGAWTLIVKMVEAQDAQAEGAGLPGVGGTPTGDDGNEWTVMLEAETYALEVAEVPGSQTRQDTVTLTIPAGGELEYKLAMRLGARVDYAWQTDGAVIYVDFHGEKTGDDSGAFVRHKNGDFASDDGTLVAPFDGRHGWYWRNDNPSPVRVTLEMRGQYDIIGRV